MRKLAVFLSIVFLLMGCDTDIKEYCSVVITNDTTKTVSYLYNGTSDILLPSEKKEYEVDLYTPPPESYVDENKIASVKLGKKEDGFTFLKVTEIELNVLNTLPVEVTIKAGNYIDNGGEPVMDIGKGETETAVIYTEKPKFTLTSDYPVSFEYNLITLDEVDDYGKPKKKMFVIIR